MHLLLERGAARPDSVGAGGVRHGRFSPTFQQSVHPAGMCASRIGCGQRTWYAPKNFFQFVFGPSTELILGPSQSIVLHQTLGLEMRWNSLASKTMAPYPSFFARCWMSPPRWGITLSVSFAIFLGPSSGCSSRCQVAKCSIMATSAPSILVWSSRYAGTDEDDGLMARVHLVDLFGDVVHIVLGKVAPMLGSMFV